MALAPNRLSVTNKVTAEMTAASFWTALQAFEQQHVANGTSALVAASLRLMRGHVRELLELHDDLKAEEVLLDVRTGGEGGDTFQ